ncbi:MAG: aminotransferase class V-fold PLP-dependent enzyme [Phycisphaerae bacterium]|nr:aminotransferase class V-fold PLP-dependent enzyme [Phycisphaerae bacterium]
MPETLPTPSPLASRFALDPAVCFLNHGSFGACPREVLEAQRAIRDRMEAEPIRFFVRDFEGLMDEARAALGEFLRCDWRDLAPVPNATVAVATVLDHVVDSGWLGPGDDILTNEHEYPACQNNIRRAARRAGAKVVSAPIPFPCPGPGAVIDAILEKVTARTRLALLSHVTSPTGLVLPVEALVRELESRGVRTLIDGAHAPGMVPALNLGTLGASYYTANCHKWICSPKGSAFLYVRRELQEADGGFRPLALSNNAEKPKPGRAPFLTEFEYVGTSDYTPFMSIPAAIRAMGAMLPGGWPAVMRHNHELCLRGRDVILAALGVPAAAPDEMIGSICTIILPPHPPAVREKLMARKSIYHDALQDAVLERWGVQVPFWGLAGKPDRFVRISAQMYNSPGQYEHLARAVGSELERERRIQV